jgi:hypothetical protein
LRPLAPDSGARREGLGPGRRFLELEVASHRTPVFRLVEEGVAPWLLNDIAAVWRFAAEGGAGIACRIDSEEAVGPMRRIRAVERGDGDPGGDRTPAPMWRRAGPCPGGGRRAARRRGPERPASDAGDRRRATGRAETARGRLETTVDPT